MAYLTIHNIYKLVSKYSPKSLIEEDFGVYESPIYIFNSNEENRLNAIQNFLKNPEIILNSSLKKVKVNDSKSFVFKESQPAYHLTKECSRLNSDFENFLIPDIIKERGNEAIERFRKVFVDNIYLLREGKETIFIAKINAIFKINLTIKEVVFENSGIIDVGSLDLKTLKKEIDKKIKEAGRFYYASPRNTTILKKHGRYSGLAFIEGHEFEDNFSENKFIIQFLRKYHKDYKVPIRRMLLEYYRIKYNPNLYFRSDLLEELGFNLCSECKSYCDEEYDEFEEEYENILEDRYYQTYVLIGDAESIEELAELRGFAISTIFKHLDIIKKEIGNECMQHLKPELWLIDQVKEAIDYLEDASKLRPIYEYFEENVSYDEIRHALLFIN